MTRWPSSTWATPRPSARCGTRWRSPPARGRRRRARAGSAEAPNGTTAHCQARPPGAHWSGGLGGAGGDTWEEQLHDKNLYLRSVGFASDTRGWVGTLTATKRLLETRDGATWTAVEGLPALAPSAVCGLSVVDESVVFAAGTNYPNRPARMMRTVDGGTTWTAWDMASHATLLIDTHFVSATHGWVVGGKAQVANPTRDDVTAVVLHTEDGGTTWVNQVAGLEASLPKGEWGWKIDFLDDQVGLVSLESFERGAILKTTDGGRSWKRLEVNDAQETSTSKASASSTNDEAG